jgi:hypothetical protein
MRTSAWMLPFAFLCLLLVLLLLSRLGYRTRQIRRLQVPAAVRDRLKTGRRLQDFE